LYSQFRTEIHRVASNITCACCACLFHDSNIIHSINLDDPCLSRLQVDPVNVPYNFATGFQVLDDQHLLVERTGIYFDSHVNTYRLFLCTSCVSQLTSHRLPPAALANFRWIGEVPEVLQNLTWIEERLIARAHITGCIYRLQRQSNASYLGLKGHAVVYPQDTRALLNILPVPPSRLPDTIRVVWTGKSSPSLVELRNTLSVRTQRVYDALLWLCAHHEDYRNVTVDYAEFARWPAVYIAEDLLTTMGHISNNISEQIDRAGPADEDDIDSFNVRHDIITSSGILDTNDISQSANAITLRRLASLSDEDHIKVVHGSNLMSSWDNTAYFTSAFPSLFPYGTGKHKDPRRSKQLSLKEWTCLLLRHCSRLYILHVSKLNIRRFQAHPSFVVLTFDISRRDHTIKQTSIQMRSKSWSNTEYLLQSLTSIQLNNAANEAEQHRPISDPAVKALLQAVNRVSASMTGSDSKRFYMFSELKSSVIYQSLPATYITLNPGEIYSSLALLYAGEQINVSTFSPYDYTVSSRRETMLQNPLAVVEYFHTTVRTILSTLIKGGLFGELLHHYGTIEYQGRGTPHIHLLVPSTHIFC
jgi:hypothetical protein